MDLDETVKLHDRQIKALLTYFDQWGNPQWEAIKKSHGLSTPPAPATPERWFRDSMGWIRKYPSRELVCTDGSIFYTDCTIEECIRFRNTELDPRTGLPLVAQPAATTEQPSWCETFAVPHGHDQSIASAEVARLRAEVERLNKELAEARQPKPSPTPAPVKLPKGVRVVKTKDDGWDARTDTHYYDPFDKEWFPRTKSNDSMGIRRHRNVVLEDMRTAPAPPPPKPKQRARKGVRR